MGLDSNLIFSQDSYIPRSSSLNLTVDLFGESINVFEVSFVQSVLLFACSRLSDKNKYEYACFFYNGTKSASQMRTKSQIFA